MILTKDNFKVFAAHYYDNPYCLSEDEFECDLFKSSVIKKMITGYLKKKIINVKLMVNTAISFYNVFDNHAATEIIKFKLTEDQIPYANSLLSFLNVPTITEKIDDKFLSIIVEVYQ